MRTAENKMSLSGTFSICFCGNTDVNSDVRHQSVDFILTTWTFSSCEIVKLKLMYIPQHLSIKIFKFSFCIPSIWVIISHQHTNIVIWNKTNNTDKIFISNVKYYSSAINIEISVKFPLVWLGENHISTRERSVNCSAFILILKILCILWSYFIICVRWIWNGSFLVRKAYMEENSSG